MKSSNKMNMKIEFLKEKHLEQFAIFLNSLDKSTLSTYTRWGTLFDSIEISKNIIKNINRGNEIAWIALIDEKIVGYQHINFLSENRLDVVRDGSLVLKKFSGIGIGSQLKKHCISFCKKKNLFKIIATVYEENYSSLHSNLKNGFLISGVFFNEEKINGKTRNVISMECPILLKTSQENYLLKIRNLGHSSFKPIKRNGNQKFCLFAKKTILNKLRNNDLKITHKKKKSFLKKISSITDSKILVCTKEYNIIAIGAFEFFKNPNKSHVSKIIIHSISNSQYLYNVLIHELINIGKHKNLEKIWINIPETDLNLLNSLIQNGFILESVFSQHKIIKKIPVDILAFSYHYTKKFENTHNIMKHHIEKF